MQAIVDFVLKDPRGRDETPPALPPHREELEVVPKPWHRSYLHALDVARDVLHVTNPCMLQVLELWHTSFRSACVCVCVCVCACACASVYVCEVNCVCPSHWGPPGLCGNFRKRRSSQSALTNEHIPRCCCRKLRLIDTEEFHHRPDSMELNIFQGLCMRHIEAAKERLIKQ